MKKLFRLSLLLLVSSSTFSQSNYKNEIGFTSDNDSYLAIRQDRYYTNGLFISFRHAVNQVNYSKKTEKKIWELEAGQYMFNPLTGYIKNPASIDRPFAGYSFLTGKQTWFFRDEQVLRVSAQIGILGPSAKGKEAQEILHNTFGFYEITGWQYQIKDEAGVNLGLNYSNPVLRNTSGNTDLSYTGYVNIGNTFTNAGTGVIFRTGKINKLFNSVSTNSRISNKTIKDSVPARELFFFAKPMLNFIAYDATIQGGLFRADKGPVTYTPNRFVLTQELGVMYAKKRWTLNFAVIFKSKEISSMRLSQQYGSANIYYRFN